MQTRGAPMNNTLSQKGERIHREERGTIASEPDDRPERDDPVFRRRLFLDIEILHHRAAITSHGGRSL